MKKQFHRKLFLFFMLAAYIITPLIDVSTCDDCIGNIPLQGETVISHLGTPHTDVSSSISDADSHDQTSNKNESKTLCSICLNIAMGVSLYNYAPRFLISAFESQPAFELPYEPSFSLNKPPQS